MFWNIKNGSNNWFCFFLLKQNIKGLNQRHKLREATVTFIFYEIPPTFLFLFKHIIEAKHKLNTNKQTKPSLFLPLPITRIKTETEETSPPPPNGMFYGLFRSLFQQKTQKLHQEDPPSTSSKLLSFSKSNKSKEHSNTFSCRESVAMSFYILQIRQMQVPLQIILKRSRVRTSGQCSFPLLCFMDLDLLKKDDTFLL